MSDGTVRSLAFGVTGSGPALVLLHPLFHTGAHWQSKGYVTELARQWTVITPDLLGHGSSSAPTEDDAYQAEQQATDVVTILDHLGFASAAAWGYSMGGWLTCALAMHAADRFGTFVVGGWDPVVGMHTTLMEIADAFGLDVDAEDWFPSMLEGASRAPDLADHLATADVTALRASQRAFEPPMDFTEALRNVADRLFLYCGTDDAYHDVAQNLSRSLNAPFLSVPHRDHQSALDATGDVLPAVVSFLCRLT
jgi:pimeloyl-ACP methyl ester carboxylesterase